MRDGADKDVYRQLNKRCSLYGNINRTAMDINSDAVAAAVMTFALDTPRWRRSRRPRRRPGWPPRRLRPLSGSGSLTLPGAPLPFEQAAPVR